MKRSFFLLLISLFFAATLHAQPVAGYGQNDKDALIKALHGISESTITDWMHTLIAPEMRGRLAGDIGYDLSAKWASGKFESWGLKPFAPLGTYFQEFPQPYTLVKDQGHLQLKSSIGRQTISKPFEFATDYWPSGLSGSGELEAEVVYVGHGISAPELGFDEYAGIDVRGKIVIVELGSPYTGTSPDTLETWHPYAQTDYKIENAAKHGAKGMLMAYMAANPRPTVLPGFLYLSVADHVVEEFLAGTGKELKTVREQIKAEMKPQSFSTGKQAFMAVNTEFFPDGKTSNVVAVIEGSDPVLKNEYMIIGAHLDHLGMMPVLFPGALDNASGSVIAMGVAKALAEASIELKRTLIILLFGAEEVGLVGSSWFVENWPYEREQIKFMINLDMVGRGNSFFAATSVPWKELLPFFERNNEQWVHRPMMTRSSPWAHSFRPRTDGAVFSNQKIPAIHFGARGATTRTLYHVPEDDMRQIEVEIMRDVIKLLTMSIIEMGNTESLETGGF
jgi:hypothetical protein